MGDRLSDVRWHNNGRGPRVVFKVGNEEIMVTAERAIELGTRLLAVGLEASGRPLPVVQAVTAEEREALGGLVTYVAENLAPQPAVERALSALSKILKDGT
jgi:hypothetical protein